MAIDLVHGYLYVTEQSNRRVQRFSTLTGASAGAIGRVNTSTGTCPAGTTAPGWCTGGIFALGANSDGQFSDPRGMALDPNKDRLYVSDFTNGAIESFVLSSGAFVGAIGRTQASSGTCPATGATSSGWCTGGVFLSGYYDGMFANPSGMAVDTANNYLYVVENGGCRINKIQ